MRLHIVAVLLLLTCNSLALGQLADAGAASPG
jgi:hypothetical protein